MITPGFTVWSLLAILAYTTVFVVILATRRKNSNAAPKKNTLMKLPLETRLEIYRYLLIAPGIIKEPGVLIWNTNHFSVDLRATPDIDATILRTCRQIYTEALPVLYSENMFQFFKMPYLKMFRTQGLDTTSSIGSALGNKSLGIPRFGLRANPQGRLTFIKNVSFAFSSAEIKGLSAEEARARILKEWRPFVENQSDPPHEIHFPALELLCLDFRNLKVKDGRGISDLSSQNSGLLRDFDG
ncbi:MAG: hypothetical protein Q9213_002201 [Squamulea squamosa]